ncbi:MAG TPA: histidine kinase [Streptosporangiaceae bacterium]|nr:histidine kinase [Streptosporangiaceae bacterium]
MGMRQRGSRSAPERYDFWTRAGLYASLAALPALALFAALGELVRPAGLAAFAALAAAQAAITIALLRASLSHYLVQGPKPGRGLVTAGLAVTAAGLLAGAVAFPDFHQAAAGAIPPALWIALIFAGSLTVSLVPVLRPPGLAIAALAGMFAASGWYAGTVGSGPAVVGAVEYAIFVATFAVTYRLSAWSLRIVWELDRARAGQARLSVAEERLRFARDLHDVLGRNLSLIAIKSELAGGLARRGETAAAAGHMLEVHGVAHESLREMWAVVGGYRTADLGAELAGARDVLRSAGISCRVTGDACGLPADVQAALGWVVREGTTNVIRHASGTVCTIELHLSGPPGAAATAMLRMDNDGARTAGAGGGTGLAGLAERLGALGGSVTTGPLRGGGFRLEATLPVAGPAVTALEPAP